MSEITHDSNNAFFTDHWEGEVVLRNIHAPRLCEGRPCTIHSPTDHPMREWILKWDAEQALFYRLHKDTSKWVLDPDQIDFLQSSNRARFLVRVVDFNGDLIGMKLDPGGPEVICTDCGDVIRSKSRHDLQWCKCGNTGIDGGAEYTRYIRSLLEEKTE